MCMDHRYGMVWYGTCQDWVGRNNSDSLVCYEFFRCSPSNLFFRFLACQGAVMFAIVHVYQLTFSLAADTTVTLLYPAIL